MVENMDSKQMEKYVAAGKILASVLKKAKKEATAGRKLLDIALNIEKTVKGVAGEEGKGELAFPVNLSLNEAAAHYTPSGDDERVFEESDVLKVDVGVHVDGFIADGAFTINPDNKWAKLIEAAELALENALSIAKEGVEIGRIGAEIERTVKERGFNPVQNLSGHGLAQYNQHASPSIPNIASNDKRVLEEGNAYAFEPFATNGKGFVRESPRSEIFAVDEPRQVRNSYARKALGFVLEKYGELPFAERWVAKELKLSSFQRKIALRELLKAKCIRAFPVLREEEGKVVAQAENSFIIHGGKIRLLVPR
jgi:methionyl aminopeptidase